MAIPTASPDSLPPEPCRSIPCRAATLCMGGDCPACLRQLCLAHSFFLLFLFKNSFHSLNDLRVLIVHVHFFFWVLGQVIQRAADRLCTGFGRCGVRVQLTRNSTNGEQPFFFPNPNETITRLIDHIIANGGFVCTPEQVVEKTKTIYPMSVVGSSQ